MAWLLLPLALMPACSNETLPPDPASTAGPPGADEQRATLTDTEQRTAPAETQTSHEPDLPEVEQTPDLTVGGPTNARSRWQYYDPRNDGWDTEVFSEVAGSQLSALGHLLEKPEELNAETLAPLFAEQLTTPESLQPSPLTVTYDDAALHVEYGKEFDQVMVTSAAGEATGQFLAAMAPIYEQLAGAEELHCKFKLFNVSVEEGAAVTRQYFGFNGRTPEGSFEENATWVIRWKIPGPESLPVIAGIKIEEYEEVTGHLPEGPLLADCTGTVVGAQPAFEEQLGYGMDYWRTRVEAQMGIAFDGHHGLAVGDVNGDGLEDVYVCQPGSLPNRLFIQQPDGTVRDTAAEAGVDVLNYTRAALLLDLDDDGDEDLVVSGLQGVVIFSNDGTGRFEPRFFDDSRIAAYSLCSADYDADGDLDIYFCYYRSPEVDQSEYPTPIPYQDANNGGANFLLRNDGDFQFNDATAESGLNENNRRFSFSASFEDYDNDGDPDLYVANDFGRNNLYRNDGGHFTDVAGPAGLEDGAFGMSVTWGDFNNDGFMDVYIGNMFSAAGNRITYQRQFKPEADERLREQLQRFARGNTLFQNMGDGTFRDVSVDEGVTMGRWSWSCMFADINNDGWEDLLVNNGNVTAKLTDDL